MNKTIYILSIFMVIFMASAMATGPTLTLISGTIYEADNSTVVGGANVAVTCTHNLIPTTKNTVSLGDGSYSVVFPVSKCAVGDEVTVSAEKNEQTGSNDGTVEWNGKCVVNTGIINVSIPEFGVIAGTVALIGAVAGFVFIRKQE